MLLNCSGLKRPISEAVEEAHRTQPSGLILFAIAEKNGSRPGSKFGRARHPVAVTSRTLGPSMGLRHQLPTEADDFICKSVKIIFPAAMIGDGDTQTVPTV